jgi:hypothetical protein
MYEVKQAGRNGFRFSAHPAEVAAAAV